MTEGVHGDTAIVSLLRGEHWLDASVDKVDRRLFGGVELGQVRERVGP